MMERNFNAGGKPRGRGLAWFPGKYSWRAAVVLLCCTVMLPVAAAFLLASDTLHNRFSVGENTSRIEERFGTYGSFEKGISYEKRVAVKNTGSIPCLVRIFAEIEDPDCREKIQIDLNKKDWSEKQEDGFYYYQHVLLPGQTSEPLFTTIKAKEDINDFRMICFSETIQSDGQKGGAVKWADQ